MNQIIKKKADFLRNYAAFAFPHLKILKIINDSKVINEYFTEKLNLILYIFI